MPSYKLTYFSIKARAEVSRMLFVAADQKFVDNRIEFKDWPALKSKTPQGALPILEIGGQVTVSQSLAIARYLAREFKFYGKSNMDALYIDQFIDTTAPITEQYARAINEKDETRKVELMKKFTEEAAPQVLAILEKLVTATGKDGYAVGGSEVYMIFTDLRKVMFTDAEGGGEHHFSRLTIADLTLYTHLEFTQLHKNLDKYPKLKAQRAKVEQNKRIAAYLKTRPDTFL